MRRAVVPFAALLVTACGQLASSARDAEADATVVDAPSDAPLDVPNDGPADAGRDRSTPCGTAPEFGDFNCCDGAACRGLCTPPSFGASCGCGGLRGGCEEPYVCCFESCRTLEECAWAEQAQ
jgi:hypothetical protein